MRILCLGRLCSRFQGWLHAKPLYALRVQRPTDHQKCRGHSHRPQTRTRHIVRPGGTPGQQRVRHEAGAPLPPRAPYELLNPGQLSEELYRRANMSSHADAMRRLPDFMRLYGCTGHCFQITLAASRSFRTTCVRPNLSHTSLRMCQMGLCV